VNYYPHNVGDYLKKTLGLSMSQDGAYRRAIDWYYDHEGPLPLKPDVYDELRCKGRADREAVDSVLAKYFTKTEAGYRHDRCDEELAKYAAKADTARENGKRGGRPRNPGITNPVPAGLGLGIPEGTQPKANQNQEPEPIPSGTGLREVPTTVAAILPGTLTTATWADWRAHLANRGKPMTPQGERLQLAQLRGHADPETIVQNAIRNGHLRLEPVGGWPDKATSIHEKRAATAAAMYGTTRDDHEEPTDITGESQRIA